jgi:hypothetical protein
LFYQFTKFQFRFLSLWLTDSLSITKLVDIKLSSCCCDAACFLGADLIMKSSMGCYDMEPDFVDGIEFCGSFSPGFHNLFSKFRLALA